jgi:hypothetical protein
MRRASAASPFFGIRLGRIISCELIDEEKVGRLNGVAQKLDPFADERRNGQQLFRRGLEAGLRKEGLKLSG